MTLQLSTTQLSCGTQAADVARVQQALQALGPSRPVGESNDRVLGSGTIAALQALQSDLGVPVSGGVDAATLAAISKKLAASATDRRFVRGTVRRPDGDPLIDAASSVQIFAQGPAGEQKIGQSALNPADGSYEIAYQPPPDSGGRR